MQWEPALCLVLAWLVVYLLHPEGTESTGKVGLGGVGCPGQQRGHRRWESSRRRRGPGSHSPESQNEGPPIPGKMRMSVPVPRPYHPGQPGSST